MFNEDILIDRNALEEECSTTPAFFDYWINQESNLKSKKENKKSELSKSIRQMSESEASWETKTITGGLYAIATCRSFTIKRMIA